MRCAPSSSDASRRREATKAALDEGVVPGGGVALLRAADALTDVETVGDEQYGVQSVKRALEAPIREIAKNAGIEGAVVVNRIRQMTGKNDGYDADKDSYCDLVEAGVIDPAKVVRTALQNASSVAALLLTTSCLLTDIPKEEPAAPDPNAMGGMGGGMPGMGGMGF